jgi:hypothetical protein
MGEAKRKRDQQARSWPGKEAFRGMIKLHALAPVAAINGARIRELTGDDRFPADTPIILRTFRAEVGSRSYHVGFCLDDGEAFSAIGIAVIERLSMEMPGGPLHVVPVQHADVAWDMVLRNLRTFGGQTLLFCFPDSDVYDAGVAEISYSNHIEQFDPNGEPLGRLTNAQRRAIREQKAQILNRPPPPRFYPAGGIDQEDAEWIFRIRTPAGKVIRVAVWNGRRNYEHELPTDIIQWVGGDKIAMVQIASPVGIDRRSSLELTHHLAKDFDGVVHWAKDTETFQSILRSFIRLDLESVGHPDLPEGWNPEILILGANA